MKKVSYEIKGNKKYPIILRKKGSEYTDPCPFCNKKHIHGKSEGHRLPHCTSLDREETPFIIIEGEKISVEKGYIIREYV